jgi:hypothetical protein
MHRSPARSLATLAHGSPCARPRLPMIGTLQHTILLMGTPAVQCPPHLSRSRRKQPIAPALEPTVRSGPLHVCECSKTL